MIMINTFVYTCKYYRYSDSQVNELDQICDYFI